MQSRSDDKCGCVLVQWAKSEGIKFYRAGVPSLIDEDDFYITQPPDFQFTITVVKLGMNKKPKNYHQLRQLLSMSQGTEEPTTETPQ
jgi:hypothetical protein